MAIERTGKAAELYERGKKLMEEWKTGSDVEKTIAVFTEVIKLLPDDDESYIKRGECYDTVDQFEKALADFDKAISLNPEDGFHYNSRAKIYLQLGENEKAKADIEKAVEVQPNGAGYFYMAFGKKINDCTGDKREAAKYLKKSIEHGDYDDMAQKALAEWGM